MTPEQTLATIFGPLQWRQVAIHAHEAQAAYRGHAVTLRRSYSPRGRAWGTQLYLRLQRPIEIHLEEIGPGRHVVFVPQVPTGDPAFDGHFRVHGSPPELVARALDPELRRRLLELPLAFGVRGGVVDITISAGVEGAYRRRNEVGNLREWVGPSDPARVCAQLDLFFDVIERLQQLFDQTGQQIQATQGPAAAQAWYAQQTSAIRGGQQSRKKLVWAILAGVALFVSCMCLSGLLAALSEIW